MSQCRTQEDEWRLIVHRPDGEIEGFELFDFRESEEGERKNPDEYPEVVEIIKKKLEELN